MSNLVIILFVMNELKALVVTLLSGIAAFLHPIADNVFAMVWLLGANFMIGLLTGILIEHESFEWKKARQCLVDAAVLFGIVAFIYIIGKLNGNQDGAIQCVSIAIYAMVYFFGLRILKNLRKLVQKGSVAWYVIDFFYSCLSFEIAKKIPGLGDYIGSHKGEFDDILVNQSHEDSIKD